MRAIFTYHSIDASGSPISCHPDAFERHLAWLGSGRIRVTTIEDLVTLPPSADAVALTFDDAFVNFEQVAAPRLHARGLPATLFVVTDRAGSANDWGGRRAAGIPHLPLLDWDALARLAERGFRIGAHTRSHPDLTRLPADAAEEEIRGSADAIERRIGTRASTFAYPYGRVDARAVAAVSKLFAFACTTEFQTLGLGANNALLPRLDMFYFQHPGALDGFGSPTFATRVAFRHALRRVRRLASAPAAAPTNGSIR